MSDNNENKKLLSLCLETRQNRGFKTHKLIYFLFKLIEEKKINNIDILKNYIFVYYNVSNNTFQTALRILKNNNLIRISRNLSDCRKRIVFPNLSSVTHF